LESFSGWLPEGGRGHPHVWWLSEVLTSRKAAELLGFRTSPQHFILNPTSALCARPFNRCSLGREEIAPTGRLVCSASGWGFCLNCLESLTESL